MNKENDRENVIKIVNKIFKDGQVMVKEDENGIKIVTFLGKWYLKYSDVKRIHLDDIVSWILTKDDDLYIVLMKEHEVLLRSY